MSGTSSRWVVVCAMALLTLPSCGGSGPAGPASPSTPPPFLTGTWRGTLTIEVNPGDPGTPAPASGPVTWTFEVVPQTADRTYRTVIRSQHPWLPIETTVSTALAPTGEPPAQVSTQGDYQSPRGCRGTLGSVGIAEATRIEADFTGVDCNLTTFGGRLTLTKQ